MSILRNRTAVFLTVVLAVLAAAACGCGKKKTAAGDERPIAKINDYEMTIRDFKEEIELMMPTRYLSKDREIAREQMLDELITKKILIQEAQKQNFDKDRAFMKEIERYWEQALLKLLLKKRSDELGRGIEVKESEVMEAYGQMIAEEGPAVEPYDKVAPEIRNELRKKKIQQAFDKWLVDLRFKSKLKVYEENLKEVEIE